MGVTIPTGGGTASGTSGAFPVDGADMDLNLYHTVSTFEITTEVSPPMINSGNATSLAMTKWVQPWPFWNFDKIASPLYDGVCQYLGMPSNKPDLIKDYHFIGLMRSIDMYLAPTYSAYIYSNTTGTAAAPPPQGENY